ncbi:MAG: YbhB/YbcL family Raf kinase inhibitor-like protein [Nanoarchaeota archaeon]
MKGLNLLFSSAVCILFLLSIGCSPQSSEKIPQDNIPPDNQTRDENTSLPEPYPPAELKLSSPAFAQDGMIPAAYTCKGKDISPELVFENIPAATKSLALILDDPDASGFTHWLVWNIPARTLRISEGAEVGLHGRNDFSTIGYQGPCPPSGMHHYVFTLFALDTEIPLPEGSNRQNLMSAMQGHVRATAELIGTCTK